MDERLDVSTNLSSISCAQGQGVKKNLTLGLQLMEKAAAMVRVCALACVCVLGLIPTLNIYYSYVVNHKFRKKNVFIYCIFIDAHIFIHACIVTYI